jgi:hypothetical protein
MPTFQVDSRRLLMRYAGRNTFSFNAINRHATDEGIYDLSEAIASVQEAEPTNVSVITVRRLL